MIDIKITGNRILLKLDSIPDVLGQTLDGELRIEADQVRTRAQALASGDVLQSRTGRYVKSIKANVSWRKRSVLARVLSRDPRAGIFEWGGHTKAHLIEATNARALHFMLGAGALFRSAVHHPGSAIGKHSVIHAAFDELKDTISAGINKAVDKAVQFTEASP